MTEAEVKNIVAVTIKELRKAGLLKDFKSAAYSEVSDRLFQLYGGGEDAELSHALDDVRADYYFRILPLYYGERLTIEQIAERLGVELSTIVRNKRRLCLTLYGLLD